MAAHLLIYVDDLIKLSNDESQHVRCTASYIVSRLLHSLHNPQDDYSIKTKAKIPKVYFPRIIDCLLSVASLGDDNESQFSYAP